MKRMGWGAAVLAAVVAASNVVPSGHGALALGANGVLLGAAPNRSPEGAAGTLRVAGSLPRANPSRLPTSHPAATRPEATRPAATSAQAGATPFPRSHPQRSRLVGRVENGRAVSLPPSAYAATPEDPVASLFEAAEATAAGQAPGSPAVSSTAGIAKGDQVQRTTAIATHGQRDARAFLGHGVKQSSLKGALDALKADRYKDAIARRNSLKDPLDRLVVDYFLVRAAPNVLTYTMVLDFAARADGWMPPKTLRARVETALSREAPGAERVVEALNGRAETPLGTRLLAAALAKQGNKAGATRLVRGVWHGTSLGTGLQKTYLADFGSLLSAQDHLIRIDYLVGAGDFSEAKALRSRLGKGPRAYLDGVIAAATGAGNAQTLLDAVPGSLRNRPGYKLANAERHRRADAVGRAARLIEGVSAGDVVNGDAWWVETRIVARMLAEEGKWRRAYQLVAKGFAKSRADRADQEFHAGFFALTGLNDGDRAERHFAALAKIASTPLTLSRAAYWRGRAGKARGASGAARRHYEAAAAFGFTYYGQLARAALGRSGTGVARAPRPSVGDRAAFNKNPLAEAVRRLIAADHKHRVWPLLQQLADTVPTAGQAVLVSELADKAGTPHLALMAAKRAQRRGLDVGRLPYPTEGIPKSAKVPAGLDRALVYAIARQESLFNPGAKSPVGAAGLMQLMPRTAAAMARELGLKHRQNRLTRDPAYNATLGAAYLQKRLGNFDGSYILTFAAYNAGALRLSEWIERFGDPRTGKIDPIVWVEQIPYPETRNYVQRVLENVQVYREALGTGRMAISSDLDRGRRG